MRDAQRMIQPKLHSRKELRNLCDLCDLLCDSSRAGLTNATSDPR
jgi:hypothetical protein